MIGRNYFRFSEITDSSKSKVSDNRRHCVLTMVIPGHRRFWEITGVHIFMTSNWPDFEPIRSHKMDHPAK